MPNSYRIRTQVGVDKSVTVKLDQDFDFLEILSLKITQSDIYTRACSDYGVVVGRVVVNDGYGLPNARVSIFIPLSGEDELDPIISTLYPYKSITDINEEGYRYNLLPYVQTYSNHTPTGTFPDRQDVLLNKSLIEVYDKYYKFTAKTNESGDFMLFGVPVGPQLLFMDLDLSDIGPFSLTPQDMVSSGLANEGQFNGLKFRASTNLYSLPQIVSTQSQIEVMPLWGDPQICQFSITRNDFDLAELGIRLQPTAIFMGSLISTPDRYAFRKYNYTNRLCKVKLKTGELCKLITGPGEIVAIRQTILNDTLNRPILEQYQLENAGKVIDENGTWLVDLPMNMDFLYTDEFGNQVISNDPEVGVPTTAKYRFKIKWEQPTNQNNLNQRGYFLVPNVKEWWVRSTSDPNSFQAPPNGLTPPVPTNSAEQDALEANYAFSLNWDDYGHPTNNTIKIQQINEAISCDDRFFKFHYNKVYTVGQFIDQYRGGKAPRKINAIKNILDDSCEDNVNQFPANDGQFQPDFIYLLFTVFLKVLTPILLVIMIIQHIIAFVLYLLRPIIYFLALFIGYLVYYICKFLNSVRRILGGRERDCGNKDEIKQRAKELGDLYKRFTDVPLANLTYPDCEMCNCKVSSAGYDKVDPYEKQVKDILALTNSSLLSDWNSSEFYDNLISWITDSEKKHKLNWWMTSEWVDFISTVMSGLPPGFDETDFRKGLTTVVDGEIITLQYKLTCGLLSGGGMTPFNSGPYELDRRRTYYSPSLPTAERLNLFNTKAKYFNSPAFVSTNPSDPTDVGTADFGNGVLEGVNQIKVTFNFNDPNNINNHHLDNVFVMSCDEGSETDFTTGSIVFFNGFDYSKDINALSATTFLSSGITSISGYTIIGNTLHTTGDFTYNTTVTWADPNNEQQTNSTSYTVTASTKQTEYHIWPADIEYFQVITAMTYSQFASFSNPTAPSNSFPKRFLNNRMSIYKSSRPTGRQTAGWYGNIFDWPGTKTGQTYRPFVYSDYNYAATTGNYNLCRTVKTPTNVYNEYLNLTNPFSATSRADKQVIVILVRGVDPYSSRNINKYDLSKIFGYSFGNGPTIIGNYKLNIPIQEKLKNARHDQISTNVASSSYNGGGIFYETFNYLPGNDYTGFTSNLISFYSRLSANFTVSGASKYSYVGTNTGDLKVKGAPISRLNTSTGIVTFPTSELQSYEYNWMTIDMTNQLVNTSQSVQGVLSGTTSCSGTKDAFEADGSWTPVDNYFNNNNRGYYRNESVEGGSLLSLKLNQYNLGGLTKDLAYICESCDPNCVTTPGRWYTNKYVQEEINGYYYSPVYDFDTTNVTFLDSTRGQKRRIVMRSDRLPTSTSYYTEGCDRPVGTNTFEIGTGAWANARLNNGTNPPTGYYSYVKNSDIVFTIQLDINVLTSGLLRVNMSKNGYTNSLIYFNNTVSVGQQLIFLTFAFNEPNDIDELTFFLEWGFGSSFDINNGYVSAYDLRTNTYLFQVGITPFNSGGPSGNLADWYFGYNGYQTVIPNPNVSGFTVSPLQYCSNSYLLHQNPNFGIFIASDDGEITTFPEVSTGFNDVDPDPASENSLPNFASVVDTLNECDKMLPLRCYYTSASTTVQDILLVDEDRPTNDWNGTCTEFTATNKTKPIFKVGNGCYILVTRPILSIKVDILLLLEWKSRLDLTFAACRNVFGHLFTNNWINGVLYAYTFRNDILFTSPFKPNGNQPFMNYCWDTIYYHKTTNTFYYRSAPYNGLTNQFIGKAGRPAINYQEVYINTPTTIVDLGPRASYLSQLTTTNVFYGYNMENITETTFRDTSDILNIFILSRLVNANFLNLLFGSNGAGILGLFSRIPRNTQKNKQKNFVDADFAQLISINCELAVKDFEADNSSGGQNPVIVQIGVDAKETMIGVFFDSDRQPRDLITPRRVIYNENTVFPYLNSFEQLPVDTQIVPFYGWKIENNSGRPTIFGTQQNNWDTNSNVIRSQYYQKQDRLNFAQLDLNQTPGGTSLFNYMQSVNFFSYPSQYSRGFIYAIKTQLPPNDPYVITSSPVDITVPLDGTFQTGAPFYFYFGLIKGATAYDRFRTKWIEGEIVT